MEPWRLQHLERWARNLTRVVVVDCKLIHYQQNLSGILIKEKERKSKWVYSSFQTRVLMWKGINIECDHEACSKLLANKFQRFLRAFPSSVMMTVEHQWSSKQHFVSKLDCAEDDWRFRTRWTLRLNRNFQRIERFRLQKFFESIVQTGNFDKDFFKAHLDCKYISIRSRLTCSLHYDRKDRGCCGSGFPASRQSRFRNIRRCKYIRRLRF